MRKVMHMRGQHRREFVSARKHRELLAVFNEGVVVDRLPSVSVWRARLAEQNGRERLCVSNYAALALGGA
jgi:hypothetical protein